MPNNRVKRPRKKIQRPLRSVSLTDADRQALAVLSSKQEYPTQERQAAAVGLDRGTLNRISTLGSGSEANVTKLRNALKELGAYTVA